MNCCFNFRPKSASGRVWVHILFENFQKKSASGRVWVYILFEDFQQQKKSKRQVNYFPPLYQDRPVQGGEITQWGGEISQGIRLIAVRGCH